SFDGELVVVEVHPATKMQAKTATAMKNATCDVIAYLKKKLLRNTFLNARVAPHAKLAREKAHEVRIDVGTALY
ncbi:MAG: hypothetical protein ACXVIP_05925, partial [Halobacteriota archaeon]